MLRKMNPKWGEMYELRFVFLGVFTAFSILFFEVALDSKMGEEESCLL